MGFVGVGGVENCMFKVPVVPKPRGFLVSTRLGCLGLGVWGLEFRVPSWLKVWGGECRLS